ncbi:MAG: HAD family hydrolase [Hungatella sp.]|jgi:Cof subfamily protein (haloacid dehalogenase superfamily)|nr:HAD family hydrolase [Hungatella sp.]
MNRKILFFDIDGTIFCTQIGRVTDRVRESIAEARRRGHLCFIASGRPWAFIAENIKRLEFDGYVLANGANIKYRGRDAGTRYLNREDVGELCRAFRRGNIQYILSTPEHSYIDRKFTGLLDFYRKCNIDFENLVHVFEEDDIVGRTLKIEAWADTKEDVEYAAGCCRKFASEVHGPGETIEIYSRQVSKATGIRQVLEMMDVPVEDSFCFGDGPNDVEMFKTVGNGFAMENGVDAVKKLATAVCPGVEQDGVALKLEELFEKNVL